MIDKDEYPQTAELERRCVEIISRLWHAPDVAEATGCSTTGSSEAAHARRSRPQAPLAAAPPAARQADRPAQHGHRHQRAGVLGEVRQLLGRRAASGAHGGRPVPHVGQGAVALCDENTIGVVAMLGSTFDGSYEPVADICAALDDLQAQTGLDVPVHVDGASGGFVAPFIDPDLVWDFRLPRVASINTSGHKYGLVYPGVGWVVWRDADGAAGRPDLLGQLPRRLHADVRAQLLPARRAGRGAVLQLPAARLRRLRAVQGVRARGGDQDRRRDRRDRAVRAAHARGRAAGVRLHAQGRIDNYTVFDVSDALREHGWQVPAYTFPADRTDLAALRVVVRGSATTSPTC